MNRLFRGAIVAVFFWLPFSTSYALAEPVDATPPADIHDLVLSGATATTVDLSWTAPGDDGSVGTAASYDIRYSTTPIVMSGDFAAATQVLVAPAPSVAGTMESLTVSGLASNTVYYFAIETQDEVPNVSGLSNVPTASTTMPSDSTPPADISDLALSEPSSTSVRLTWSAPGDDGMSGTAAAYDIRYSTSPIVTDADFAAATEATAEPAPAAAGAMQSMVVGGLASSTLYYFAIETKDEVPNASGLSNLLSASTGAAIHTGNNSPVQPNTVLVVQPNGGESLKADQAYSIVWSGNGSDVQSYKIFLSTDGGTTWTSIASAVTDNFYAWAAPNLATSHARIRVQAIGAGNVVLTDDESDFDFIIAEKPAAIVPPQPPSVGATPPAPYDVANELASVPSIDANRTPVALTGSIFPACVSGTLMKLERDPLSSTQQDSTVYYCGADGKRYVFPDAGTYFSWYPDFSKITAVSKEVLAASPIGGNVVYRPGTRMIKIQTDPRVYAVSKGGVLRFVTSEAVAAALYGPQWNHQISDISDAFFVNYSFGDPITMAEVTPP